MKILRLIHSANPQGGGVIEGVRITTEAMISRGHTVDLVTLDDPQKATEFQLSIPFIAVGPAKNGYGYCPSLDNWLREQLPAYDCAIIEGIWQYHGLAIWRATRHLGSSAPPYFVFTHGMLDPWFKRAYPLKHLKKWLYWPWGEYRVLRDARAVLFTCEEERLLARESFWLYRANEQVVCYGTVRPSYKEASSRAAWEKRMPVLGVHPFWLFLGRLQEKKGVDLLIKAYRSLDPQNRPDLVIAGPEQDPAYASHLRELAGGQAQIHFVGMISGEAKWGALLEAEALILPSHQENFGIVVAEALAAGTPALITRPVNIWREVESHGAGMVDDDTIDGVKRLMLRFQGLKPDEQQAMAASAKTCFDNCFDIRQTTNDLLGFLQQKASYA